MTMVAVAMAVAVAVAVGDKGEVARGVTTSYATDTRGRRFMSMCRHIRSFCWDQEKEKKEGKIGIMDDHPVKMRTVLCTDAGYD